CLKATECNSLEFSYKKPQGNLEMNKDSYLSKISNFLRVASDVPFPDVLFEITTVTFLWPWVGTSRSPFCSPRGSERIELGIQYPFSFKTPTLTPPFVTLA